MRDARLIYMSELMIQSYNMPSVGSSHNVMKTTRNMHRTNRAARVETEGEGV